MGSKIAHYRPYTSLSLWYIQEEAERWKKRGNDLSKEPNLVDQVIACYSLALNFTPAVERELKATIFSNRSLMYNNHGKADQALRDAQNSVENNPRWPKARMLIF